MSKLGKGIGIFGGTLVGAAAIYLAWSNRRLFFVHDITTGESAHYPELRSRVYYADETQVLNAAKQSLRSLPRWKLISCDTENNSLEAEAGALMGLLTDDVTIYVISLGHGQTRVTLRARSRSNIGDFGQNALHIRELQQAMDDRLNAKAAF